MILFEDFFYEYEQKLIKEYLYVNHGGDDKPVLPSSKKAMRTILDWAEEAVLSIDESENKTWVGFTCLLKGDKIVRLYFRKTLLTEQVTSWEDTRAKFLRNVKVAP